MTSMRFYEELEGNDDFDWFFVVRNFTPLPDDWWIIVTDIENSTGAIAEGKYREVNAVGVATISAVLKVAGDISIPYVFGGDGASFCVPPPLLKEIKAALAATQKTAQVSFGLTLRNGFVPITQIRAMGKDVQVGKYQPSQYYHQAMFVGGGMAVADQLTKNGQYLVNKKLDKTAFQKNLFDSFECRWDEIPAEKGEVVNLLIKAIDHESLVYLQAMQAIKRTYGDAKTRCPLTVKNLSLAAKTRQLDVETKIRSGLEFWPKRLFYLIKLKLLVWIGRRLMQKGVKTEDTDWGEYKQRLIEHTDFQRFDDTLRIALAGSAFQRDQLLIQLDELKQEGKLYYGYHVTSHSLVTCVIEDYNRSHVHFIDGTNGGFTAAAHMLKQQIKNADKISH